jgi:hypothetical protein
VTGVQILLDEHVGRIFERLLRERGYVVEQAKDRLGERTSDAELIAWCGEHRTVLLTNNAKDFESLHDEYSHAGMFIYYDQKLPDNDPEGLARTVDEVFNQYGRDGVADRIVDLGEWYEWLHQ